MIRGTRMIVITKNKLTAAVISVLIFAIFSVISVRLIKNEAITAFLGYEDILSDELFPAEDKSMEHDTAEKKRKNEEIKENRILRHFFVLKEAEVPTEKENIEAPKATPEASSEPLLKSESVKIDKGLKVSNATPYQVNPEDFINKPLSFSIDDSGPQVLIMHTHTTESFSEETYPAGAPDRNLDETKNITAVGAAMAEVFEKKGINVIHDKTVHDYPSYNGAYQKAAATINKNLSQNSGIKVVLDVHRDGITRADGTKVKLVTDLNGEKVAQIMLVVGSNVNLQHDNWQENFKLASKIQSKAIEMFPSLMRPIDLRQERFNEQLTIGSLIVEVGSNGNTMSEAVNGGKAVAEAISAVLKQK